MLQSSEVLLKGFAGSDRPFRLVQTSANAKTEPMHRNIEGTGRGCHLPTAD